MDFLADLCTGQGLNPRRHWSDWRPNMKVFMLSMLLNVLHVCFQAANAIAQVAYCHSSVCRIGTWDEISMIPISTPQAHPKFASASAALVPQFVGFSCCAVAVYFFTKCTDRFFLCFEGCAFVTLGSRQCAQNAIRSLHHSRTLEVSCFCQLSFQVVL